MAKTGSLTINSENIFPIIKKWLYSDHDIFYRELVSNGCDAITKLKKLEIMGEWQKPEDVEFKITVTVDSNEKTITFADNGLGMTMDEVDEYINQILYFSFAGEISTTSFSPFSFSFSSVFASSTIVSMMVSFSVSSSFSIVSYCGSAEEFSR